MGRFLAGSFSSPRKQADPSQVKLTSKISGLFASPTETYILDKFGFVVPGLLESRPPGTTKTNHHNLSCEDVLQVLHDLASESHVVTYACGKTRPCAVSAKAFGFSLPVKVFEEVAFVVS